MNKFEGADKYNVFNYVNNFSTQIEAVSIINAIIRYIENYEAISVHILVDAFSDNYGTDWLIEKNYREWDLDIVKCHHYLYTKDNIKDFHVVKEQDSYVILAPNPTWFEKC